MSRFHPQDTKNLLTLSALVLVASIAFLPLCRAANFTWLDTNGGFYESTSSWIPHAIPSAGDNIIFGSPGDYGVAFLGSHEAEDLLVANNAGISLHIGGDAMTDVDYNLSGNLNVEFARLTLESGSGQGRLQVTAAGEVLIEGSSSDSTKGSFTLQDDATFTSAEATLGLAANSYGRAQISGALTDWQISGPLTVGYAGGGKVTISDGASVTSHGATLSSTLPNANETNIGTVLVSGVGSDGSPSTWTTTNETTIGYRSPAALRIEGGAVVTNHQVYVAEYGGSEGFVDVVGTDAAGNPSTWNTGILIASYFASSQLFSRTDLKFEDGALVNSDIVILGGNGGARAAVRGTDVNGNPTTWNIAGDFRVAQDNYGYLDIQDGGQVNSVNTSIASRGMFDIGRVTVTGSGTNRASTWSNTEDVHVGGVETGPIGNGRLEIFEAGRVEVGDNLSIWSPGKVTLDGGFLAAGRIDHTNGGDFDFQSGVLQVGIFEGDLAMQAGTLAPGPNAATTTVLGNVSQQSASMISIEVGGTTAGLNHDLVNISGQITLDGDLELSTINGFVPAAGQTFTVLATSSLFGVFDNVPQGGRLETANGSGSFVVNYGVGSPFAENRIVLSDFLANPTLPGDFDADGDVDSSDFLLWQRNPAVGNLADWQANYGAPLLANILTVPEPSGTLIFTASLLVTMGLRIRNSNGLQFV